MKRKLCGILLVAVVTVFAVCSLTGCVDRNISGLQTQNVSELQMNKKYIHSSYIGDDETNELYFIFHSNGTGQMKWRLIYENNSSNLDYTVTFKYTYVDNDRSAVVCFYDSVQYGAEHMREENMVDSTWSRLLTVSKNVLCYTGTGGYTFYINEDYLNTIPNFGA